MANEKKSGKGKETPKAKGPRKSGKYKTVKTVQGAVAAPVKKKKAEKPIGPVCGLTCTCKFARVRIVEDKKERRYCSVGIVEKGSCNYAKWGKKMRATDFVATV